MEQRKNKLMLMISLLLIIGFGATSLASYFVSRSSLRDQIVGRELPLTSDNIYSEIQRDLLRTIFISSLMANDTFLRDWVIKGEEDEQQIVRYLQEIRNKYNAVTSFFVSEQTRIYYQAKGILKKVQENQQRDIWYFRVRALTSDYEINIDPDMANNDSMTIFINFKVFDYDKKFIGATGVGLKVSAVKELIKKYQKDYDRQIYFTDKQGNITLHGSNLINPDKPITRMKEISPIADEILSKSSGCFKYKRDGKTVHLNTRYIPEFDWYLLVEQTEEKAIKQILHTLLINLAICALITSVVLVLTNLTISSYQGRLEKMATIDKLTGIYNRQAFDMIFHQLLQDIQRKDFTLSIILFDIDRFKNVNDQFGHLAGDAVIKNIVKISNAAIRRSDVLCRWGGEEFLILLKKCSLDDAYTISEKIRNTVAKTSTVYEDKKIIATISLGVGQYRPFEKEDIFLSRVDKLLYKAKQNGRNRSEKEFS
ncbi:sensor domain-containing diguanylate cyclase [Desulfobacula phenolica]|uniref:diguanylate cyclase n=1 Tax=Desulfobacula phenolica TaxID=90732 RepID=A0A1H2GPP8_9BACT|nr:sensor domain-containing diguanylate cyclase [Desulfobacula phenolica]SDU21328.1 diguanylate cyclase (GGDEF) domain-containing protein [Desulfobacula phenolica]